MDLTLNAKNVSVTADTYREVTVELDSIDTDELFKQIDAQVAVTYYGEDTLLDLIGRDKAIEYFGIEEAEAE